jgi:dipeptidyl aminopeptidase/acylaminoacyl peptidase/pSer/pThr/pTyr-binding forkhead associated (FHA) protein
LVRRLDYKHDGLGYVDGRYHHLFVVPAGGGDAKQLTNGAWDIGGFDWSPDSTRLVVAGNAEPDADLRRELNLYLVDLEGKRQLLGGGYYLGSPIWSPGGDQIAFIAPNGLDAGLIERLWVVSLNGGGPRCLTAELDLAVNDSVINDMRSGHDTRVTWSAAGDRIYFVASAPGVSGVYSVDLEGVVRQEAGGQRRIHDFDIAAGVLVFLASDPTNPGELHMLMQGAEARLTDLNPWLNDRYVAQPEQHYFTAPDGWKLEGWLLKPSGLDPNRLHPLILQIHGGPHGQYGWSFFHELQVLAGMGYVVLYLNPRGSDGYGEVFRRAVVRDWGGKDYIDLMSALDQIIDRTGYIDTARIGVGGGSYGGFMTNWIIGQTSRFSAAVAMRSISNLVSEYAQHDIVLWGALEMGPAPWPDLEELWRRSPIRYVQNVRTPLLLTAGEMDLRCAMSQSEEMFGALRLLGKTVELVRFPEESHDLSRNGRPDRRVERLRRIAGWYERFLGTGAVDRVSEEMTQLLPRPAEATREWATTVAIEPHAAAAVAEVPEMQFAPAAPVAVAEPMAESAESELEPVSDRVAVPSEEAEPEVIKPAVLDTATAEQPIVEPEALPDLPGLAPDEDESRGEFVEAGAESPELPVEAEPPEPEPVMAEAPTPEPEPKMAEFPPHEAEPVMVEALTPEPEPVIAEAPTPEPEPVIAEAPTPEPEPVMVDAPTPEPEPVMVEAPTPVSQPVLAESPPAAEEPAVPEAEPEPEPAPTAAHARPDVSSTIVAWPSTNPPATLGNGSPSQAEAFDEATSVIPVWQHSGTPGESKRTVSLQAVPLEEIEAGTGFAALLTFETGPFAGRIVALPSQMVTVGRAPDNDVVVGDPATSGHHGRIDVRAGSFWISDLGSTNGTQVNGEPVIERQLADGDLIAVGQNTIRFTLEA